MIDFVWTDNFNLDLAKCFIQNGIRYQEKVAVPSLHDLKKVNFGVRKGDTFHLIWTSASQKERWRAIDRDAILINRDQSKYSTLNAEVFEFWYVGRAVQKQNEPVEDSIQGHHTIGIACAGFKDDHVLSTHDTVRFSNFIETLS